VEDDAQAVLTALREDGRAVPSHVLRNRLGWDVRRFMPAVSALATDGDVVRVGDMLSLPVANFAMPTLPDEAREESGDQEPVSGPDVPMPGDPDPPASGGRFLVATEWEEYEDEDVNELADRLLKVAKGENGAVLIVHEADALIFERAVVARRRS
jgi:hypothetical protein